MEFKLTKEDINKFNEWKNSLPFLQPDIFGSEHMYEFVFYPTGLGLVKKIKRADGMVLDLTNYNTW